MHTFISIILFLLSTTLVAQTTFQRVIGDSTHDFLSNYIIETKGGYVISGIKDGSTSDSFDPLIIKLSETGEIIWEKHYSYNRSEFRPQIIEANDSGYIVGATSSHFQLADADNYYDILLFKIDENGNKLWEKSISANWFTSIISAADGSGYFIAGEQRLYSHEMKGPNDVTDLLLMKVDNFGDVIWRKRIGTNNIDGNSSSALIQANDSTIIIAGRTDSLETNNFSSSLLAGFNNDGQLLWKSLCRVQDNNRYNMANNFLVNKSEVLFQMKDIYSINPLNGSISKDNDKVKEYFHESVFNNKQSQYAAIESKNEPSMLFYDSKFNLLKKEKITQPNTFQMNEEDMISTYDGGYAFLLTYEQEENGTYPNRNTILVVKTDCNGNSEQWLDCNLGQTEAETNTDGSVSVYPNPFNKSLTISVNSAAEFIVYDGSGRKVQSGSLHFGETAIDTSELLPGFYTIQVNTANEKVDYIKVVKSLY